MMIRKIFRAKVLIPLALALTGMMVVSISSAAPGDPPWPQREAVATNGMVAAIDHRAAEVGAEVLKKGGNAVDACVTTAFLMAVYEPANSGLGGHGGHMAFYNGKTGEYIGIDGSTRAPMKASPDMFKDEIELPLPQRPGDVWRVKVKDQNNNFGFRGMFAPSTVAQYAYLMKNFGTMSWRDVIEPAIKVASEGFVADSVYVNAVNNTADFLKKRGDDRLYRPFIDTFQPGGVPLKEGQKVTNPQMANTLRRLADNGPDWFYEGEIADQIVDWVSKNGGVLSKEDFTSYEVETGKLATINYRGHEILSYMNGANGSVISEVLSVLNNFDLKKMGYLSPQSLHTIIEAMKIGFTDRYAYTSDRDFVPVPYDGMISWGYGRERAKEIDPNQAKEYEPGDPWAFQQSGKKLYGKVGWSWESIGQAAAVTKEEDTTFMAAVDKDRNMILVTSSNQSTFGSRVVVPGLGFVLNSSMYNANPVPGHVLSIEPGKRILRNSGPVIVAKDGKPVAIMSAPGGRQIITSILTTLINMVDYGMGPQGAVDAPRYHAEAYGRDVSIEDSVPAEVIDKLKEMGHEVKPAKAWTLGGSMVAIKTDMDSGLIFGGTEPRTHSGARGY